MKRVAHLVLAAAFCTLPLAFAQAPAEHGSHAAEKSAEAPVAEEEAHLEPWKWANFLVLVGGLGYLIHKHGGPFFAARSREIKKEYLEAADIRADAEKRVARVDARLANLQSEIDALRREAATEQEAEVERVRRDAAADIAKIEAHARQEIESATKAARMDLKAYAAELAISLAEQKIARGMTPEDEDLLLRNFVGHLARPSSRAQTT
jgi:F-type H+-transporting ATPase subunit b